MVLTHLITWVYKDSLSLRYPSNHQYLTGTKFFILMGRFFDTIIDFNNLDHAFTYIPVQHWFKPLHYVQACTANLLNMEGIVCKITSSRPKVLLLEVNFHE